MKILLYGENWEGTHVDSIAKVLNNANVSCQIFDFYKILNRRYNNRVLNKIWKEINYTKNEKEINTQFLQTFDDYKPDVVLISKGVNIFPETLHVIQRRSAKIINWNPDDFFNNLNNSKHLLNSLPLFDTVYSARKHLFQEYKSKGIKNPVYLEWYYIPWLHKKNEHNDSIAKNITFVGTYSKRRGQIIEGISDRFNVELWGSGWEFSKLKFKKNIKINQLLRQSDFPEIMSRTAINLNILTIENRDETNLKIFEIPASNGFLLSEKTSGIQEIMKDGLDCEMFESFNAEELNTKINKIFSLSKMDYLEIRNQGRNKIVDNNNSINDRVTTILREFSL